MLVEQEEIGPPPGGHEQRQRLALAAGERADRVVHAGLKLHVQRGHAVAKLSLRPRRKEAAHCAREAAPRGEGLASKPRQEGETYVGCTRCQGRRCPMP